jgi:uncharacterized protein YqgC (DUF456 family)
MTANVWAIVAALLMAVASLGAFIPVVPGPAAVWAIALVYAAATQFTVVDIPTTIFMTVLMLVGSTADTWTRAIGLRAEGQLTCGMYAITTVGAIVGTVLIPIPVLGTLLGAGIAVAGTVWFQEKDWQHALTVARGVVLAWLATFFVEFLICLSILGLFVRAVWF